MKPAPPALRLDGADRRLVEILSRDGRRSGARLASELGVSRQAVAQRIRELERRGVIHGFRADVDAAALGLTVRAHIRLNLNPSLPRGEREVVKRLLADPRVRAVHRVSGEDCFVVQVVCRRIEDVAAILAGLQTTRAVAGSRTSFVLETLVDKGSLGPAEGLVEEA
ncbi:MAG TPA: Lrp/AsnC family transcriptional regulator [Vicinamibacteria bacterium]|nr:Lrp/AsnC family transcriptional regulator [Vicinamibacteria bacterium]